MILRYWRGWTTADSADAYEKVVEGVLADIAVRDIAGYRGAFLLRRDLGEETEFATALLFDGIDSVREFAGEDYELAYVPDNARAILARYDERSAHFEVLLTPDETSWPASLARPPRK
jgi:hypothetical protein